jgi:Polyketide cyclase / dehydrase and lipid transport
VNKDMDKTVSLSVSSWSAAPPRVVYDLLRNGASWPQWSPIESFDLEKEGRDGGESVGAIRVFKTRRARRREELVSVELDTAFRYVTLTGPPVRADITLSERDGGTLISWHEDVAAKMALTRWFLRRSLRRFVQRCADGLAAHATASTTP